MALFQTSSTHPRDHRWVHCYFSWALYSHNNRKVTPDPYCTLTIGSESWTTTTQHGKNVTWYESHTFSGNYNSGVPVSINVYDEISSVQGNNVSLNIFYYLAYIEFKCSHNKQMLKTTAADYPFRQVVYSGADAVLYFRISFNPSLSYC